MAGFPFRDNLFEAVGEYQRRDRRYGGVQR